MAWTRRERPDEWARWWVWMWAVIAVGLIVASYLVPFRTWAWLVAVVFGVPEAIGVWTKGDRFPPLTFVAAWYVPRWAIVTLVGFLVGSIGGTWFEFARPWALGALFGLAFWALDHFQVTAEDVRRWTEG